MNDTHKTNKQTDGQTEDKRPNNATNKNRPANKKGKHKQTCEYETVQVQAMRYIVGIKSDSVMSCLVESYHSTQSGSGRIPSSPQSHWGLHLVGSYHSTLDVMGIFLSPIPLGAHKTNRLTNE